MKKIIRFGIIGCSSIAARTIIPTIIESKLARLEIIGSRSISKAKKFATKFKCDSFGNYWKVLENENVDAVYISLPTSLHEKWAIHAAEEGKHILCEKSVSTSFKSAAKIVSRCRKNNVRIMEGFSYKFHPQHKKVQQILKNNTLGKFFGFTSSFILPIFASTKNFRFNKKLGGGILNDVGCYIIDSSRLIMQKEPLAVTCNLHIDKKFGVDTRGSIYISFPEGKTAFGIFGYEKIFLDNYTIFGERGTINLQNSYNVRKNFQTKISIKLKKKNKIIRLKPSNQSKLMIDYFSKELINLDKSKFEDDILQQAKVLEAARLSNLKKRLVLLRDISKK